MANRFILPSSSTIQCQDRFDLLGSNEDMVPFWDLLVVILTSKSEPIHDVASLIEALENIAISLRGTSRNENHDALQAFMTAYLGDQYRHDHFFDKTWPFLVNLALDMPALFPDGALPDISFEPNEIGAKKAILSRRQIACLVVHQFLCSLPPHPWETESFVDLRPWFAQSNTSHPGAVHAYLTALFTYFENIQQPVHGDISRVDYSTDQWPITFTLRSMGSDEIDQLLETEASRAHLASTALEICHLAESQTEPTLLGLSTGACVISANKCFGYGPTGTQEELHVGISPEVYPVVLLAPPLSENQVLVCQGAEPIVTIKGYGRSATLDQVLPYSYCAPGDFHHWKQRAMLFMDALEMDILGAESDLPIPDIYPVTRLSREMVLKAFNAFRKEGGAYSHIVSGLWGCKTFGGNRYVKCLLQWCAASLAQIPLLKLVFAGPEQKGFADELNRFSRRVKQKDVTVKQVFDVLAAMKDSHPAINSDQVFDHVADVLRMQ